MPRSRASGIAYEDRHPAPPLIASVAPAGSPSSSIPNRAVNPFIGSVAAWASVAPSGIGTTDAAGTTMSSA